MSSNRQRFMKTYPSFIISGLLIALAIAGAHGQEVQQGSLTGLIEATVPTRLAMRDDAPLTPGTPLREADTQWIEATLAGMTLDEKIGQMIMPGHTAGTAAGLIANYHVGGFIFQGNSNTAPAVQAATNNLQLLSPVPLLFSTDCEAGLGARFTDATRFPFNMGAGAAYDLDLVRQQGAVTARECRAIGIHIGFGPVLDTNTEPANPIIGVRSYGDRPTSITALARAYVEGARSEGLLATFKHFPGHGASTVDSHLGLPRINISYSDIMNDHVSPYAPLIAENHADLIMTAHVWYPALDPGTTAWPATLSTPALSTILRGELNYDGCIISDSFGMAGLLEAAGTYDAVRIGVLAGLDIILTPDSVPLAVSGLRDAVNNNQIPESRIDASVRRILALKSRVGMPEVTTMPASALATVSHPQNVAVAEAMARKTIASHQQGTSNLPIAANQSVVVYVLSGSGTIFYSYPIDHFTDAFDAAHADVTFANISTSISNSSITNTVNQSRGYDKVVVVSREWRPRVQYSAQRNFVNALVSDGRPVTYVSLGSPYHYEDFSGVSDYLCGFSSHYETQEQMVRVLLGQAEGDAHWPVGLFPPPASVDAWELY